MKHIWFGSLAILLTAASAQALPLWGEPMAEGTQGEIRGCADFRGKFAGSCTMEGRSSQESFEIEQTGCELLNMGGRELPVGGHMSVTLAKPALDKEVAKTKSLALAVLWSADKQALQFQGGVLAHGLKADLASVDTTMLSGEMKIAGDELTFTLNKKAESGTEEAIASCTYTRQQ